MLGVSLSCNTDLYSFFGSGKMPIICKTIRALKMKRKQLPASFPLPSDQKKMAKSIQLLLIVFCLFAIIEMPTSIHHSF